MAHRYLPDVQTGSSCHFSVFLLLSILYVSASDLRLFDSVLYTLTVRLSPSTES